MQWSLVGNIFLLTFNVLWAQTYIIKVKSGTVDAVQLRSSINSAINNTKSVPARAIQFSITAAVERPVSDVSGFSWNRYAVIRSTIPLPQSIIQSLSSNPAIDYVQPSVLYKTYSLPNDSAFVSQWNLRRIGITALYNEGIIVSSLPRVRVGVIDTGVDDEHPDLMNILTVNPGEFGNGKHQNGIDDDNNGFVDDWRGFDFVQFDAEDAGDWNIRDNDPADEHGHGTSVAGIIGAQSNNVIGLSGIAPAGIVPLRAFGKNGNGNDIDIAAAIIYAADNGVDVINMSFGDVIRSSFLHDAIRYAYSKNVVLIASSGNDGSYAPHYPSDFPEVISTGAVGQFDGRSFFSSYSPSLDLMAPGEQIVTTTLGGGYTDQFSGTSAAAPHVAGVSAILKSLEKQKKQKNPSYKELSSEEIRGILLNTADDAGSNGWDKYYGAGIVNARTAVGSAAGSVVMIHSPKMDEVIHSNSVPVIITAVSPYLHSVSLSIGAGTDPNEWTSLQSTQGIHYSNDTLTLWNSNLYATGDYILRLTVSTSKGEDIEFRQRISIGQFGPAVSSFRYRDSIVIGDQFGTLVEARTDRNTTGILYYRRIGTSAYHSIRSPSIQKNHSFLLTSDRLSPSVQYEYYCQFTEQSPLERSVRFPTLPLAGKEHFTVTVSSERIQTTGFLKKSFHLPKGFVLNSIPSIDGKPNLIMNTYSSSNDFGPVAAYAFGNGNFAIRDSSSRSWIPRAFNPGTTNTPPSILVQDHGFSRLFTVDTISGKYFSATAWGDSTDVWASGITDLDGDNVSEIIARSSSEYLLYKKSGSTYTIAARLPNPSLPLPGDARNQFGPPRSITGKFTGSGLNEIIVADYDGDLLMYRQPAAQSIAFSLAGIDTSDLYDMSDYVVAGDFTGDGTMDFAVAGHSNMDWNSDREYDAPVWTLRVFSHRPSDDVGKVSMIWQQHFVGVKAGSGYDNGLSAGKLRTSDTQDALIISFNPSLYILQWNGLTQAFDFLWHHSAQSNNAVLYDFDGDGMTDIGFNTNERIEFWSLPGTVFPPVPYNIAAHPVSASSIRLSWNSSAVQHRIFRGTHPDSLMPTASVNTSTVYRDTGLTTGRKYFYAVAAVTTSEGERSLVVSATPKPPAIITSVLQQSQYQFLVTISSEIASHQLATMEFVIDTIVRSSGIAWKSSNALLVTFPLPILPGSHALKISQLTDADGMFGDTTQTFLFSATIQEQKMFFVRTVTLTASNQIKIEFNDAVNYSVAKDPLMYSVRSNVRSFGIGMVDSLDTRSVLLTIPGHDLTRIAVRIEIRVSESVISENGIPVNDGKGQTVSVAQETASLEKIVVYPNPAKQTQRISFTNIPPDCKITVFTATGERIAVLPGTTTTDGISWDLRTETGNLVSTGIYLYRVEQFINSTEPVRTTIGKFAVIR